MIKRNDIYKVLLPNWIFKSAKDKDHLQQLVLKYMSKYPHYYVNEIKDCFAYCIRIEIQEPKKRGKRNGKV